jgi:hypothetical protein
MLGQAGVLSPGLACFAFTFWRAHRMPSRLRDRAILAGSTLTPPKLARIASLRCRDCFPDVRVIEHGQFDRANGDGRCQNESPVWQFLGRVPVVVMAADASQARPAALVNDYFFSGWHPFFLICSRYPVLLRSRAPPVRLDGITARRR